MSKNQTITYIGRVLDREKQAPISRAKISLNFPGAPPVVYTDLEGIFRFPVNFANHNIVDGQITIEADGYKSYDSFMRLSSNHKDIGDIRLITPQIENENRMLMLVIASMMIAVAIFLLILTKSSNHLAPENQPSKFDDESFNFHPPVVLSNLASAE